MVGSALQLGTEKGRSRLTYSLGIEFQWLAKHGRANSDTELFWERWYAKQQSGGTGHPCDEITPEWTMEHRWFGTKPRPTVTARGRRAR